MTLCTRITTGPGVTPQEVYAFCRELLETPEHIKARITGDSISNPINIGLAAILQVDYNLTTHECEDNCTNDDYDAYFEHKDWERGDPRNIGWATMEVSFDTRYGYRGQDGETCGELHATLIYRLGTWLESKGVEYKWQDESSGTWYTGLDDLEVLCRQGNANRAFLNSVLPTIIGQGEGQ